MDNDSILSDPATRNWVKLAYADAQGRDLLDAYHDAVLLCAMLARDLEEIFSRFAKKELR